MLLLLDEYHFVITLVFLIADDNMLSTMQSFHSSLMHYSPQSTHSDMLFSQYSCHVRHKGIKFLPIDHNALLFIE